MPVTTSPSSTAPSSATDVLEPFAERLHEAIRPGTPLHAIHLAPGADGALQLGLLPLPQGLDHPISSLVGFRAPSRWEAIGVAGTGRSVGLGPDGPAAHAGRFAYLVARDGSVAATLDRGDRPPLVLREPAIGVVPDVLARVLGNQTPPPGHDPDRLIEAQWLDRLAAELLPAPPGATSWAALTECHPLRPAGPAPDPHVLAAACLRFGAQGWAGVRRSIGDQELPASRVGHGPGSILRLGRWFDDGSLERWLLRDLPPVDEVLDDLLEVLPDATGDRLVASLVSIDEYGW
jgi:hypothetical protein